MLTDPDHYHLKFPVMIACEGTKHLLNPMVETTNLLLR